ncbi:MAG: hypothetical protein ACJASM_002592 [Salibacteraceae bacterium]
MKRLVYIISHGHTARGALQTGLLERLSTSHEVHVVAKKSSIQSLEDLRKKGIRIHAFEFEKDRRDTQRGIFRSYVHQNIKRNPALWEKHLQRTRNKKNSLKRRLLNHLFFYLGSILRLIPAGNIAFTKWEQTGYLKPSALELLKSIDADAIISTRPVDEMEMYLLEAAKRLDVHRIFYILSWDNITSKGIFPVLANSYLTWGPIMNEELQEYYNVQSKDIYLTGVTHFDVHAQVMNGEIGYPEILDTIGLNSSNPYLFFTMSASYFAPNEIDIVEHLAQKVESNAFGSTMQLVVRPHMANLMADRSDQSWLKRLKAINSSRVKVDFPDSDNSLLTWYMAKDDMVRLSSFINKACVCLNSGSTIAIEAIYINKHVIITAFDTEKWPFWSSARRLRSYVHLDKLFKLEACYLVDSLNEMDAAIDKFMKKPDILSENRQKAIERECFKNDGKATERFVENTNEIMRSL